MECLNCGSELINLPKKRQKIFCSSTCRTHYWQKSKRVELGLIKTIKKTIKKHKGLFSETTDFGQSAISENRTWKIKEEQNKSIPPIPTRNKGEDVFDYAERKNDWKQKYGQ